MVRKKTPLSWKGCRAFNLTVSLCSKTNGNYSRWRVTGYNIYLRLCTIPFETLEKVDICEAVLPLRVAVHEPCH